jgi:hypothetical protein
MWFAISNLSPFIVPIVMFMGGRQEEQFHPLFGPYNKPHVQDGYFIISLAPFINMKLTGIVKGERLLIANHLDQ